MMNFIGFQMQERGFAMERSPQKDLIRPRSGLLSSGQMP